MDFSSLEDVLKEELADLYSAEEQLIEAIPKMARGAHAVELREAFEDHLQETYGHVTRLELAFAEIGMPVPTETCEAMQGLIQEGRKILEATGNPAAIDAALIAAAQRVEHYEMAAYGTARALASELGLEETELLLSQTLEEESKADNLLSKLAEGGLMSSGINRLAAR